jgi:hypothetical protein
MIIVQWIEGYKVYFPVGQYKCAAYEETNTSKKTIIDKAKSYKNDYNSLKHFRNACNSRIFSFRILFVSMLNSSDIAGNYTNVFMVKDTANFILIQM